MGSTTLALGSDGSVALAASTMNVSNNDRIDFYRDVNVRARIREFIGSSCNDEASSEFLSATDADSAPPFKPYSPLALNWLFSRGCEICRSLWDREGLLADFDIEYVNFDDGAEAFVNQERIFSLQEPVERAIKQLLEKYRINCLHMLSGRGHHFVWRIKKNSIEFARNSMIKPRPTYACANKGKRGL